MVEVIEEIILLAPGERREQESEVNLADDDEALLQVDGLRVGSWVEFQEKMRRTSCVTSWRR